ncbi:activating signal cointegrator 1 complex subunit 2 [Drosophila tropicalis]|uniref:activating signal cointegrator 1 complex subunit 2 n=1 Tax=Drosophila tropicalis TaxID=46794 RepID=UPI0035ABC1AD
MLDNDTSNNNNNNNWNPQKLSLNELKITLNGEDGVRSHIPALDEHWVRREKPFSSYLCQMASYGRLKSGAALEEWTHRANNCKQDFEFLLSLNQHEFWSYMVYEESAMAALVTFLQRANPFYRLESTNDDSSQTNTLYEELLNLVMRIILRLCTARESATEWMTQQQHSDLLYTNYLISIPLLFDIIIALGDANPQNFQLLREIFAVVLHLPADYMKDLREGLAFYENAFLSMQIQVENEGCEGAGGGAFLDADSTETPYDDVVLFALDCSHTLRVLMALSGEVKNLLDIMEQLRLGQSIANFYDLTVPVLYRNIYTINPQAPSLRWLNEVRQQFLAVIRAIVQAQLEAGHGQQLVDLLQECLSAQSFVVDYQRHFPIKEDIDLMLQRCPNIKNYKVDFVLSGYEKALSNCTAGIMADEYDQDQEDDDDDDDDGFDEDDDLEGGNFDNQATENKTNSNDRDIDLEVTAVLDVLPDLGMGFIRRILSRYENSEQAIAAILDDNLPPDLAHSDRQEIYVPPDPQEQLQLQTGVKHYNVHDGDRYDILSQNQPQCIIKQGKGLPGAPRNAEQLLDDKRDLSQLKSRYQQYTLVEETTGPDSSAEYDDEYDDSYEALNAGQAPPVSLLRAKLQADASAANSAYEAQDAEEDDSGDDQAESSNDDEGASPKPQRRGMDFCENPEITRARYQQRQMAKYGQRAGGGGGGQQSSVVGDRPKGQGQSQQTQRNRNQKEANKSSRANHNRKAGAAFKRSKGMLP